MALTYEVTLDEESMVHGGDSTLPVLVLWGIGIAVGVTLRSLGWRTLACGAAG